MLLWVMLRKRDRALEEWEWAMIGLLPVGGLFLGAFIWNLLKLPARHDHIKSARIKSFEMPVFPTLSEDQWIILSACAPGSLGRDYVLNAESFGCKLNQEPLGKRADGSAIYFDTCMKQVKHMETHEIVEVVDDKIFISGFRFRLTPLALRMLAQIETLRP